MIDTLMDINSIKAEDDSQIKRQKLEQCKREIEEYMRELDERAMRLEKRREILLRRDIEKLSM